MLDTPRLVPTMLTFKLTSTENDATVPLDATQPSEDPPQLEAGIQPRVPLTTSDPRFPGIGRIVGPGPAPVQTVTVVANGSITNIAPRVKSKKTRKTPARQEQGEKWKCISHNDECQAAQSDQASATNPSMGDRGSACSQSPKAGPLDEDKALPNKMPSDALAGDANLASDGTDSDADCPAGETDKAMQQDSLPAEHSDVDLNEVMDTL